MKQFKIKSPSGKMFNISADSIYHAVQQVVNLELFKYSNIEILKLNK